MISKFLTLPISLNTARVEHDPQRTRCYCMEREFIGSAIYHRVPQKDLRAVANHVCRYYRVPKIPVVVYSDPKSRKFGMSVSFSMDNWATEFGRQIRLNRGFHGANIATLLHELAHYISDSTYQDHEAHGKEFVGIYMHLLDKYRVLPSVAFRALAKKWRVKISGRFKPDAIRG